MTEQEILKSMILGLISKTESNSANWLSKTQFNKIKGYDWNNDDQLDHNLYLILDKSTTIQYSLRFRYDHSLSHSYLCIENSDLQTGRFVVGHNSGIAELKDLEDLLIEKYAKPMFNNLKKNYQTDLECLSAITAKCGIEAVRDLKVSEVLSSESWLKKIWK